MTQMLSSCASRALGALSRALVCLRSADDRCWSHSHFLATCYVGIVLVETFNKHSEGLVEAALLGLARYGAFGVELGDERCKRVVR